MTVDTSNARIKDLLERATIKMRQQHEDLERLTREYEEAVKVIAYLVDQQGGEVFLPKIMAIRDDWEIERFDDVRRNGWLIRARRVS